MPPVSTYTNTPPSGMEQVSFLHSEANGRQSRTNVTLTVAASTTLKPGTVLGRITASGKYVQLTLGAATGAQTATAILGEVIVNGTGAPVDVQTFVIDTNAVVRKDALLWPAGAVDADKTAALTLLFAKGIKALD